ncbi:MAG: hypothetical protein JNM36_04780 [Chitinophagales bacterium]|nr:hypothetical protein [Chitinophagales bacterium]
MTITESSITLNFPDNNVFRFQDCQGYRDIQHNFKEMDVCWYEQATNTLYIIELKDWGNGILNEESDPNISAEKIVEIKEGISAYRVNELWKKSVDSVSMFMSILLKKPYSQNIQSCSSFIITHATKVRLLSIINWTSPDVTYIASINSAYKSRFKSYAKLYDIKSFIVMTKTQAITNFDWIS